MTELREETGAGQMNRCSKWAIVKTSALPTEDHAEHSAWGLCRDTVSSQGLISSARSFHPHFTLLEKGRSPASPHILLQIKSSIPLLCIQLHNCTHAASLHLQLKTKHKDKSHFFYANTVTLKPCTELQNQQHYFFNRFILFQKHHNIFQTFF